MNSKVLIPVQLKKLTNNESAIIVNSTSIRAMVEELEIKYPGIKDRLMDETNNIRKFINIYVNGEDIRFLSGIDTAIAENSEISIIPASAGG